MGGGHGEAGESMRHTSHRLEHSSHVTGGQDTCWDTLERAGKGKGILGSGEHRWQHREQSGVVPGSTGQGTPCHCQENKELRSVKRIARWRYQSEEEPTGNRKEEDTQNCGNSPGQGWIAEFDLQSNRQDVEWLTEEPEGSWGLESSEVCQPKGRSDFGGSDQQKWKTSKYHHWESRNAETIVLSPKWAEPVLWTTPSRAGPAGHNWASGQTSPISTVCRESPRSWQVVFWSRMPTLGVGETAIRGTGEGTGPNRTTPSPIEAGEQDRNAQTRNRRLHKTQGLSLHFTTKLHGESCWKSECRATAWRGWEKRTG